MSHASDQRHSVLRSKVSGRRNVGSTLTAMGSGASMHVRARMTAPARVASRRYGPLSRYPWRGREPTCLRSPSPIAHAHCHLAHLSFITMPVSVRHYHHHIIIIKRDGNGKAKWYGRLVLWFDSMWYYFVIHTVNRYPSGPYSAHAAPLSFGWQAPVAAPAASSVLAEQSNRLRSGSITTLLSVHVPVIEVSGTRTPTYPLMPNPPGCAVSPKSAG